MFSWKRYENVVILAFLFVVLSGFAVALMNSWSSFYGWNLIIHPLLGIITYIPFLLFFRKSLKSADAKFSVRLWMDVPAVFVILFSISTLAIPSERFFFSLLVILCVYCCLGLIRISIKGQGKNLPMVIVLYLGLSLEFLSMFSGLSILFLFQSGGIKGIFIVHRILSIIFAILFFIPICISEVARIFKLNRFQTTHINSRVALLASLAAFTLLAIIVLLDKMHLDPSFNVHLSTIPLEQRLPEEQTTYFSDPAFPPAGMDLVRSCTQGMGCHGTLEKEFLDSNHNISLMTPHFQKNMALLTDEIGIENTLICAGCHIPSALFDRSKDYKFFKDHNNFSCSFCHMIGEVKLNPDDNRRSSYMIQPPSRHLKLFLKDGVEAPPDQWTSLQIKLSPLSHGRAFMKDFYSEDAYCIVCHHHQLHLNPEEGLARPKCIDCHMQPQYQIGLKGNLRNHFMPGANLTVPHFADRPEAVEIIHNWIQGEYLPVFSGWENLYTLRKDLDDKPYKAIWLAMVFESVTKAIPGQNCTLKIITTNAGMEHPFPAAPLDLIESWLELAVEMEDGTTIYESGNVGEYGWVDHGEHTLGGHMIGMDEKLVKKNRVWQIKKKVVERVIEPGHHIEDTFTFQIPEDATGFLTIKAHWNYRKLNQEFLEWAYGVGTYAPVVRVGSLEGQVKLERTLNAEGPR